MTTREDDLRVKLGRIRDVDGSRSLKLSSRKSGALPKGKDIVPDAWEARKRGHVALPIVVEAAEPAPPLGWRPA
jgi:hypothetical protein